MKSKHQNAFERDLGASSLFATFDPEHVHELAKAATRAREPKGMVFSREGERGEELVVLLDGSVEVRHAGSVIATLGPGSYFGEMALLDQATRRSATVVAITPVVVAYLSRHHFDGLLAAYPEFADAVRRTIDQRSQGGPE